MGKTSVMVANAFTQDVWVKADSVLVQESASSKEFSARGNLGADILPGVRVQGEVGINAAKFERHMFSKLLEVGFLKMDRCSITTFNPPQNTTSEEMKTVFVTIGYVDSEGKMQYLATNSPHNKGHSFIITKTGGIVDSKGERNPWVDLNGRNHLCKDCFKEGTTCRLCIVNTKPTNTQNLICMDCQSEGTTCTLCLVNKNLSIIQISISAVQDTDVAHSLLMAVDKVSMQEIKKKEEAAYDVILDIKKLADQYRVLETRTRRTVRDVKDYGEKLKGAAEDYVEDGDNSEFLQEIGDIENLKISLKEANEQHGVIKGQVKNLRQQVDKHESSFNERAEVNKKRRTVWDVKDYGEKEMGIVKKVACGVIAAPFAVVALGVYVATLPIALPVAAIIAVLEYMDAKNYKILETQFKVIAKQMTSVEVHLSNIVKNIDEIESNLNKAKEAEEKVIRQNKAGASTEKADREKRVNKLVDRANALIASCDDYFNQLEIVALKIAEIK